VCVRVRAKRKRRSNRRDDEKTENERMEGRRRLLTGGGGHTTDRAKVGARTRADVLGFDVHGGEVGVVAVLARSALVVAAARTHRAVERAHDDVGIVRHGAFALSCLALLSFSLSSFTPARPSCLSSSSSLLLSHKKNLVRLSPHVVAIYLLGRRSGAFPANGAIPTCPWDVPVDLARCRRRGVSRVDRTCRRSGSRCQRWVRCWPPTHSTANAGVSPTQRSLATRTFD
jgi:hypothetical protein